MSRAFPPLRSCGWAVVLFFLTTSLTPAQAPRPKRPTVDLEAIRGEPAPPKAETEGQDETPASEPPAEPAGDEPKDDPEDETTEAEAVSRPATGILGDTSRFTRMGGWGGIGGTMGQWGMGKSMLVMMPAVQEELGLTEEQRADLREWSDQMRQRGQEQFRSLREQGGDAFRQADAPIAARLFAASHLMTQLGGLLQENEAGIQRILDADQRKRLTQIALQMEGVAALGKPEVARAVNLSPSQNLRIQQVLSQSRSTQLQSWITQLASRGARPGPGGGQQAVPARPGARTRTGDGGTAPERPAPTTEGESGTDRRARSMQQFETMRGNSDRIQEQAVAQVLRVLTKRQRETFDKLLGEPFDPSALNTLGGPRPRPDPAPRDADGDGDGES